MDALTEISKLTHAQKNVDMVTGDCDTAPTVVGAFHNGLATGPYSEGMVLRYMCSRAYDRILGGSNYYQCYSGVWTGGNIGCKLGSCIAIDSPSNSYIVGKAGYYVGETTRFSCQEGYEMNGEGLIMCMADRTWSPELPTCAKVRCPEFSTPDAEIFQDFVGIRNEFGSKNKITCKGGTVLEGPQYITCLANKTWSGSPRCTVPNCGNPTAYYENCTKEVFFTDGSTDAGSQVEVICLDNAVPTGASPFLICTNNGTWKHEYRCLCGCIVEQGDSVYTGPINVMHNTEIDWPCLGGRRFKRKCVNGTLTSVLSCSVAHPTTPPPPYPHIMLIAVVVSCVVVCTIAIIALNFFCCPYCKNSHAQLRIRCKFCFQDKRSSNNIPLEKEEPTSVLLVEANG